MKPEPPLLVRVLLKPEQALTLAMSEWDVLVRQARNANLLGSLASRLANIGLLSSVPTAPKRHLESALLVVEQQQRTIRWEVECLREALSKLDGPMVLLKGAAYLMLDLPVAHGRFFSDVDILVPKARLGEAERRLMIHGWIGTTTDPYDQKYYREWMHEIPPLCHRRRHTAVDVHHSILPETARIKIRSMLLFEKLRPVTSCSAEIWVLDTVDMVLHSATHLFHEGELENGLRHLFDLDALFRHFQPDAAFWETLVPRAMELGLLRPLYYALRYTSRLLDTPIPLSVLQAADMGRPPAFLRGIMDFCFWRAFRPAHTSCQAPMTALALTTLYVRSHWIRMPFILLSQHLLRKAWRQSFPAHSTGEKGKGNV